jgi:hypothetical protein
MSGKNQMSVDRGVNEVTAIGPVMYDPSVPSGYSGRVIVIADEHEKDIGKVPVQKWSDSGRVLLWRNHETKRKTNIPSDVGVVVSARCAKHEHVSAVKKLVPINRDIVFHSIHRNSSLISYVNYLLGIDRPVSVPNTTGPESKAIVLDKARSHILQFLATHYLSVEEQFSGDPRAISRILYTQFTAENSDFDTLEPFQFNGVLNKYKKTLEDKKAQEEKQKSEEMSKALDDLRSKHDSETTSDASEVSAASNQQAAPPSLVIGVNFFPEYGPDPVKKQEPEPVFGNGQPMIWDMFCERPQTQFIFPPEMSSVSVRCLDPFFTKAYVPTDRVLPQEDSAPRQSQQDQQSSQKDPAATARDQAQAALFWQLAETVGHFNVLMRMLRASVEGPDQNAKG